MQAQGKRIFYFDNAKFILIFLVVVGHLISPYSSEYHLLNTIYKWIYTFHMPAFILISGYFAKNINNPGYLKKIFIKLIIPYLIFQLLFTIFFTFQGDKLTFSLFEPQWTLWFLLSMIWWHILLYLFVKMKLNFIVAIIIGLLIGSLPTVETYLSLSRTFVFFPFFLAGFYLKRDHFEMIRIPILRVMGLVILVSLLLYYHFTSADLSREWLFGSFSYSSIGVQEEVGLMIRLAFYCISFMTVFCFMTIVPERKYYFTNIGTKTLYIYLLHGLTIKLLDVTPILAKIAEMKLYILFLIIGLLLCFLLASKPILMLTRPLIEPLKKK